MDLEKQIEVLILEARELKFIDNCEKTHLGTFGRVSPKLESWYKNCERIIYENAGVFSEEWKNFEELNIDKINGNFSGKFDEIKKGIIDILRNLVKNKEIKTESNEDINKTNTNKNVFIVHGQDEGLKNSVARFIEKLNYIPIILHEQASFGKTIIEKFESYSNVAFGVVLYTGCDEGRKANSNENIKKRARQNVIFEHGYLNAKIGRNKVCALVENQVEIPNDLAGVIYIEIDSKNAWKYDLAKEMKNAGLNIDLNLIV